MGATITISHDEDSDDRTIVCVSHEGRIEQPRAWKAYRGILTRRGFAWNADRERWTVLADELPCSVAKLRSLLGGAVGDHVYGHTVEVAS